MTDKQKAARLKNLEKGRLKRQQLLKQKKDEGGEEYEVSSSDSSSSDSDDLVISRRKPTKKTVKVNKSKSSDLENKVDQLSNMVTELANLHKTQTKRRSKKSGGTKIIMPVMSTPATNNTKQPSSLGGNIANLINSMR